VGARKNIQAGDALEALLRSRDSGAEQGSGRSLLLCLVRLHELGALSFEPGVAVHGDGVVAEQSTVGVALGQDLARGAGFPGGGRVALDDVGAVVWGACPETVHPYNMDSLSASTGDAA